MEVGTILGLVIGFSAILLGNALEGGHLGALFQPTALLIVVGGTIGATLVGTPLPVFVKAVRAAREVFVDRPRDRALLVQTLVEYAQKARRDGIIALENALALEQDAFLKKAMMMTIDGLDSKTMRENLELVITHIEDEREKLPKVWESAGGYAPTIGIIGAVMGLIHVMQNLSNVSAVGAGIAVAFVATIYGVTFANLLLLPIAAKMKGKLRDDIATLELILTGALAIQEGQNPNLIRDKLEHFASDHPVSEPRAESPQTARA